MKVVYNREDDVLMVEVLPEAPIDHAEQVGSLIVHFSPDEQLVLLEILQASKFLSTMIEAGLRGQAEIAPLSS